MVLNIIRKIVPREVFGLIAPAYHACWAYVGASIYGFPSKKMKVIGVTGTKGKSSVVYLTGKILERSGSKKVAVLGSMGFRVGEKEWPNTVKMTMPGRFMIHKYMAQAQKAGSEFFIMEVTSEGIKQNRHLGIDFDCVVFTGLHKEHIESHGSFENYYRAKQKLFQVSKNIHVFNADDPHVGLFWDYPANKKITYGVERGDIRAEKLELRSDGASFECYGTKFDINLSGKFNVSNVLAAATIAAMYDIDLPSSALIFKEIKYIPGRMEFIQRTPFSVVVDYAHTPDSLRQVYAALKPKSGRLISILGAAGGGRDKWKRFEFGKIADEYCDHVILTDEDPYEEDPGRILDGIMEGIKSINKVERIMDRRRAIGVGISMAENGDVVIITGKGSETTMAIAGGKKIEWSDKKVVEEFMQLQHR